MAHGGAGFVCWSSSACGRCRAGVLVVGALLAAGLAGPSSAGGTGPAQGPRDGHPAVSTVRLTAAADAEVADGSGADTNAGSADFLRISGYFFDPSPPAIAIEPVSPRPGDRLKARITVPSTTASGGAVRYAYLWHRAEGPRLVLMQRGDAPALQTPVQAGERWRVIVVANAADGRTGTSWAEAQVAGSDEKEPPGRRHSGAGGDRGDTAAGRSASAPADDGEPAKPARRRIQGEWGQFQHRRAYVAFDAKSLAGRHVTAGRLALYARPDVSWFHRTADIAVLVHAVPRERALFEENRLTWRTQPLPNPAGPPLGRIDLPGRFVTQDDPDWQAWSALHGATWATRSAHAAAFSNDPRYGFWRWREVDVTAPVAREVSAGAAWITFCLAEAPRGEYSLGACAVRSREYEEGRFAPALVVTCAAPGPSASAPP